MLQKVRTIDPETKYHQVLDCALRLFVKKGYHRVSIPDIVGASGVSTGAIYNLFGSKENLARTLHQQILTGFQNDFVARLVDCETAYDKLRAFAELVYEKTDHDPITMEYLLFMKHAEFMGDMAPICMTGPFRLIRQIVTDGMAGGEIRQGDYFISAVSYTGAILRPAQLKLECVLEGSLCDMADELIANAWAAIKA
ncbi:TetR/AcrR family transcriptional regulator [Pelovirga terrestris]|nr:TetR/AcrR family transcriptional regulator [Pelovirga terrestris]